MYKDFFKTFKKSFLGFFITLQNYVNAQLDKTVILMILNELKNNNRTLSTGIEYY